MTNKNDNINEIIQTHIQQDIIDKDREIQKLTQENLELDKLLKESQGQFYKQ
jgi:hypothetical protein